jgi:hypothetical protein
MIHSYHAKTVEESIYKELIETYSMKTLSPHTKNNIHLINTLRHSVLCIDIFNMLFSGCIELEKGKKQSPVQINLGFNEIIMKIDKVLTIKLKLETISDAFTDEDSFIQLLRNKYL